MFVRSREFGIGAACGILLMAAGCRSSRSPAKFNNPEFDHYKQIATDIEYPTVEPCSFSRTAETDLPHGLESIPPTEFWNLRISEAISLGLQNTDVLKEVGGQVLTAP